MDKPPAPTTMNRPPLSPPSESNSPPALPLDHPIRTTPIHDLLPEVRVPREPLESYKYNPVNCAALDAAQIEAQIAELRAEFPTSAAALKAQEIAAKEAKQRIEDVERKREDVQKAMDKKVKERNTEMKVLEKYQASG